MGIDIVRTLIKEAIKEKIIPTSPDISGPEAYGTHSCKRTLLHWAALDGLPLDVRRLLGGHVLKSDGSLLAYSVEGMSAPLERAQEVGAKDPENHDSAELDEELIEPASRCTGMSSTEPFTYGSDSFNKRFS
eukprot:4534777-Amphidinium_carterae.1